MFFQAISTLLNGIENNPNPNVNINAFIASQLTNSTINQGTLTSLLTQNLAFQNLHDIAYISLSPAISKGIGGARNYSLTLAEIANNGGDLIHAQVNLLQGLNRVVIAGLKYQAANAQLAALQAQVVSLSQSEPAVVETAIEMQFALLSARFRTLTRVDEACAAYVYATTLPCPNAGSQGFPNLASSMDVFVGQVTQTLQGLENAWTAQQMQAVSDLSWTVTDRAFIGNLSSKASAILDLTDSISNPLLEVYDNIHMTQIALKPIGIRPLVNTTNYTPTLNIFITSTGAYYNTATLPSGARIIQPFMAPPFASLLITLKPTDGYKVVTYGSLIAADTAYFYVPSVYSRLLIAADPNGDPWDWSKVTGLKIEVSGYVRAAPGTKRGRKMVAY